MNNNSEFFKLSWSDLLHGLFVAVVGAILTGLFKAFQTGSALNWVTLQPVLIAAIASGLAYLSSQLVTNSQGELMKSENSSKVLDAKDQAKKLGLPYGKIILIALLLSDIGITSSAQGLFHKVTPAIFKSEVKTAPLQGTITLPGKLVWRIDATFALDENVYHKDTKEWVSNPFAAVGPAIGIQHYVPTSLTDPTPYNNWGVSAGVAAGVNILKPDFSSVKLILGGNILQFIKGGFTFTLNNKNWFGYYLGTGITF